MCNSVPTPSVKLCWPEFHIVWIFVVRNFVFSLHCKDKIQCGNLRSSLYKFNDQELNGCEVGELVCQGCYKTCKQDSKPQCDNPMSAHSWQFVATRRLEVRSQSNLRNISRQAVPSPCCSLSISMVQSATFSSSRNRINNQDINFDPLP